MQFITDLHVHSKYSRAVSPQMILPVMAQWAAKKGLDIISAADFTHPLWFREIKSQLMEETEGLYKLKSPSAGSGSKTRFILSTEISSIYKQGEKLRRIHSLVFMPNFEAVEKFREVLIKRGANLMADGRPIIGISCRDLLEIILNVDKRAFLIPCHVWTPHFGIYGNASGFDSLDEAFSDLSPYIYGIETGLSSDPEMNWQVKELESRSILSFSDAHSTPKMGREATVFIPNKNGIPNDKYQISNKTITYRDIASAIKRDPAGKLKIGYTIEFYPEEGKYHFSGHRNCGVVFGPEDIRNKGSICPVCRRSLTEGVLFRVGQLGDEFLIGNVEEKTNSSHIKWYIDKTKKHPPYVKLVPLIEIIAESLDSTVSSEKVLSKFDGMCKRFGSEMEILLKTPINEISSLEGLRIAEGIEKVRKGDIAIKPGFDGEYGKVKIWKEDLDGKSSVKKKEELTKSQLGLGF